MLIFCYLFFLLILKIENIMAKPGLVQNAKHQNLIGHTTAQYVTDVYPLLVVPFFPLLFISFFILVTFSLISAKVLKMDHHCPFVNNCIGFFNYKYFFNFLFWVMVFNIYVIVLVVLAAVDQREFGILSIIHMIYLLLM